MKDDKRHFLEAPQGNLKISNESSHLRVRFLIQRAPNGSIELIESHILYFPSRLYGTNCVVYVVEQRMKTP